MIQLDNGPWLSAMLHHELRNAAGIPAPWHAERPQRRLEYLETVEQYGDTTDASAQVKALRSYGLDVEFVTDASWETLEDQIARATWSRWRAAYARVLTLGRRPLVRCGGHEDGVVVNDLWAKPTRGWRLRQLITAGQSVNHSREHWGPRWLVEGPASGWAIIAKQPGTLAEHIGPMTQRISPSASRVDIIVTAPNRSNE